MSAGEPLRVHDVRTLPRRTDGRVDLDACLDALGPADLLETADGSGWSYVVPHTTLALVDDGARTRLCDAADGTDRDLGTDPMLALEGICRELGVTPDAPCDPGLPPMTGGLVGMIAYDLGYRLDRAGGPPPDDRGRALLHLRVADRCLAVDPTGTRALLLARHLDGPGRRVRSGSLEELLDGDRDRLAAAATATEARARRTDQLPAPEPQAAWTSLPRRAYRTAVERVLAEIARGEVFQVNLTQRLTAHWHGDVHHLYRSLRAGSPAPFGASLPGAGIASISPESFLAVEGRHVTTRPIKGTRPRAADPQLDAALADDLATSTKDRAENVMVVDLERNDLGRICRPGSVRVPELTRVVPHPTVWHLVSEVRGELADGVGYGRLLAATFPCGSITGAPKLAAMASIARHEPVARGAYTGAIGFLSPGRAHLSVAIRTAVLHASGIVDHGAGGGIVADSDPDAEHAESLDKAAAFLRAVRATQVVDAPPRPGVAHT